MAKLIFKYGAMGSAKSANLLMTAFNFEEKNKRIELFKPVIDSRDGNNVIASRTGLSRKCTMFDSNTLISNIYNPNSQILFIDEAQFLSKEQIDDLVYLVDEKDVLIFCYGLRTDFCSLLFDGSKRLFEIADKIEEVKSICECGNKASINCRISETGKIITDGEKVYIGGNNAYKPMCRKCWTKNK